MEDEILQQAWWSLVDLYVLDNLLRPMACVDTYESLIWTERFAQTGDLDLKIASTYANRTLFVKGALLAIKDSTRVMVVENIQDEDDADGSSILSITGYSLEDILNHRVAYNVNRDSTFYPMWTINDTPGNVCRIMFDWVCRNAHQNPNDVIPFLTTGSIYPADTVPETTTEMRLEQTPAKLYDAIKTVCDTNELGFRLVRSSSLTPALYFDIYAGIDCTTRQTTTPAVVFSADLDDLQKTTELTQTQDTDNVAYVYSPAGFMIVYGEQITNDITGFRRKVLLVDGSSVTLDNPDISGALQLLGETALRQAQATKLFDGEINQYSQFKYDVDYRLGDIVEVRNRDGERTYKRVTEQIFASDENGVRSYPTLATDLFANEDDWLSLDSSNVTWGDYEADLSTTWQTYGGLTVTSPPEFTYAGLFQDDFMRTPVFNDVGGIDDYPWGKPWYPQIDDFPLDIVSNGDGLFDGGAVVSNGPYPPGITSGPGNFASILLDLPYDDFEIESDWSYAASTFVIDWAGPHGMPYLTGNTWYQININADGSAALYSINGHVSTPIASVAAGHFPTLTPGSNTHIKFRAKAGETTLTIGAVIWNIVGSYTPNESGIKRTIKILLNSSGDEWRNFSVKAV